MKAATLIISLCQLWAGCVDVSYEVHHEIHGAIAHLAN